MREFVDRVCINCGKTFSALVSNVAAGNGKFCSHSCCAAHHNKRRAAARPKPAVEKKTSARHGMSRTRLYQIWADMRTRCSCKTNRVYGLYGGRGISVCPEWSTFEPFMSWAMANGYEEHLTIDRVDVDGNYCPENCRWATMTEQGNNRRNNHRYNGHTIAQLEEMTGINRYTIKRRLKEGWSFDDAINTRPYGKCAELMKSRKRDEKGRLVKG